MGIHGRLLGLNPYQAMYAPIPEQMWLYTPQRRV
ncbi:MAG: hypothetical protein QOJ15_6115, partial [Bradyrhizobium sp.]|nr:hypothetical protein [Bradyrhizobium sp.]